MAKAITAATLLRKHVTRKDRVLLVNPPVEETRYSWLRWNQPLDLLKLGPYLRSQIGCRVQLLDCMKPDKDGKVPDEWLPRDRRYSTVGGMRYPMRRFGRPHGSISQWLASRRAESQKDPTQVWITSLCSYWFESVAETCRVVKQTLPDATIVLLGQYPRLMTEHACEACAAEFVVSNTIDVDATISDLGLYEDGFPPFVAVRLDPPVAVEEIQAAVKRQVLKVTFFEDDLGRDNWGPLSEIVAKTRSLHKHLRFHAICGLAPQSITPDAAFLLAAKQFAEIHFEETDSADDLDLPVYKQALTYLREAGLETPDDRLSGFVWIGRPGDELEKLIIRSFRVVEILGNLILKPFSPTPGGAEHKQHAQYLTSIPHQHWSPHFFPFAELNGITREEYHDLYRMAAFLNEKVRSRSFDFLNGTLGAELLRESLKREVWKLEPSPLRIVD
jgi:hypothetical protein